MKKWCIVIGIFIVSSQLNFAQSVGMRFSQTTTVVNPERYGNGNLVYLVKGDNLMTQGFFERAILAYDNAIALDPFFAEALVKRAVAKYRLGRVSEARQDFDQANSINPYANDLYGNQNNFGKLRVLAFEPYKWLLEISLEDRLDHYEQYYKNSAMPSTVQRAITMIKNELDVEALNLLYNTIDQEVTYTTVLHDLIGLIYSRKNQWASAENAHQSAIRTDANFALAYYNLSVVKKEQGQYQEAISLVNESLRLAPDLHQAYFQRATLYKLIGKYELALEDYQTLSTYTEGKGMEALFNKAITKAMSGDAAAALQDINRLINRGEKNNAVLYKLRGNAQMLLGRYQFAINDYTRAIQLDDKFAEAYFNRGVARLMVYNRPDGCFDLEEGVSLGYEEGAERFQLFCGF